MAEVGERLDKLVAEAFPQLSRSRVQSLIRKGHVRVDGELVRGSHRPGVDAHVIVEVPAETPVDLEPLDLGLELLYRDAHLAVVVKPSGLVVHPASSHQGPTLVHGLLHALEGLSGVGGEQRPGIVHRLDKGTSGVMVVACDDVTHRGLQEQFAAHSLDRRYWTLVYGGPDLDAGTVRSNLGRHPTDRLRFATVERGGREAITHWSVVERLGGVTLMECRLETGRTHQVRVHLSESGFPVVADPVYRRGRNPPEGLRAVVDPVDHQLLHAYKLAFEHPVEKRWMEFEQDLPADFQGVLDQARQLHSLG
ncbi:MAG: RluA family pseudouridine synthase [Myxococcota bacterium]|nr:RluA family pseudouridine synthase [Myxococcota bacterium]